MMSRMVSFAVLLVVIGVCGLFAYRVLASFLLPLFLAALLVIICEPIHQAVLQRCKHRRALAAALTTAGVLLTVLAPLGWVMSLAILEGVSFLMNFDEAKFRGQVAQVRSRLELDLPFAEPLNALQTEFDWIQTTTVDLHEMDQELAAEMQIRLRSTQGSLLSLREATQAARTSHQADDTRDINQKAAGRVDDDVFDPLEATLTKMQDLVDTSWKNGTGLGRAPTREFLARFEQIELAFRNVRHQLLGGTLLATVVELANPSPDRIRQLHTGVVSFVRERLFSVTGATTAEIGGLLLGLFVMVVSMFYFLLDGATLLRTAMRLSPLDDRYEQELLEEFNTVSRAVVLATLLSAVLQGILAGVGYFLAGFDSLFLLTVLTIVFALVPFVGAAAMWVPACLWLAFVDNRLWAAGVFAVWGVGVISMVDNIVKPWVLQGQAKLHPLLALLSVLGGVQALGPIGILVGPMLVSFLQALLNILQKEIRELELPARSRRTPSTSS